MCYTFPESSSPMVSNRDYLLFLIYWHFCNEERLTVRYGRGELVHPRRGPVSSTENTKNAIFCTENAIFGPTSPGRNKISCEGGFIGEKRKCKSLLS